MQVVVYNCFFAEIGQAKMSYVMSFYMQFEKKGKWVTAGGLSGVRGSVSLTKREGGKKKVSVLENKSEHWSTSSNKNKCTRSNCVFAFFSPLSFGQPPSGKPPAVTYVPFFKLHAKHLRPLF